MTKKKVAAFFTAAALCGALAVGSSMAYLTDHDSVTNKFSVGKVDIVGHEPNYTPDNDGKTNNIVPTQVIKKDPQIENVGKNDAYVYLDVSIPIAKVITVNAAGNRLNGGVAKDTELFSMNNVSKKWTLMYNKRVGDNMVYTYSYNEILAPGKDNRSDLYKPDSCQYCRGTAGWKRSECAGTLLCNPGTQHRRRNHDSTESSFRMEKI